MKNLFQDIKTITILLNLSITSLSGGVINKYCFGNKMATMPMMVMGTIITAPVVIPTFIFGNICGAIAARCPI